MLGLLAQEKGQLFLMCIMKIQILLLLLAPGVSVDTKYDKKIDIGIRNLQ